MKLYKTGDHVRFLPGGGPMITIPKEVQGICQPKDYIVNMALMLAGQNDPCFTAMTAFGIRYVGWMLAQEDAPRVNETMIYVDAPSGVAIHISAIIEDRKQVVRLVREGLKALPNIYQFMIHGRLQIEVQPMEPGQVIAFV